MDSKQTNNEDFSFLIHPINLINMKVYPVISKKKKKSEDKELTATDSVTKAIALIVAFLTVAFFFFKILFL